MGGSEQAQRGCWDYCPSPSSSQERSRRNTLFLKQAGKQKSNKIHLCPFKLAGRLNEFRELTRSHTNHHLEKCSDTCFKTLQQYVARPWCNDAAQISNCSVWPSEVHLTIRWFSCSSGLSMSNPDNESHSAIQQTVVFIFYSIFHRNCVPKYFL